MGEQKVSIFGIVLGNVVHYNESRRRIWKLSKEIPFQVQ